MKIKKSKLTGRAYYLAEKSFERESLMHRALAEEESKNDGLIALE